jgi:D-glycero-D-manno-heptose 1,7-bisphosphate phosphatase
MPDSMDKQSKLVILDRDGVINQDSDAYIKTPEEWVPIEGSLESIALLSQAGFTIAVATNQSGIARQLFDQYTLARIHQKMCNAVEQSGGTLDGVFYCPHGPDEGCNCRKPQTGMLEAISREFNMPLQGVPLVGDSLKDIQAARQMGCRPYLVRTGKGMQTLAACDQEELQGVQVVDSLEVAARLILAGS